MREDAFQSGVPSEDLELAEVLVSQGLIPRERVDECLVLLRNLAAGGVRPLPRLREILAEKGYLTSQAGEATVRRTPGLSEFLNRLDAKGEAPAPPKENTFESRYAVAGELARGGMGAILDARDLKIRRELAIKVLLDPDDAGPDRRARFIEEAQIQGQLEHPNICPVHELGVDARGRPFFAMKKVKGRSLAEILARPELLRDYSLHKLLEVFTKVCDAVAFAHSRGVVHRDLKPHNIMIGEFGEVLVMDWGLAKIVGREDPQGPKLVVSDRIESGVLLSMDGTVLGTPSYMPPEQAEGRVEAIDERSDVYALGGILYAILTLQPPVDGRNVHEILAKVARNEIEPPSRRAPSRPVPADLEAAAMKALARSPASRYSRVTDFRADITAFLEGRTLAAAEYSFLQLAAKWYRRNRVFALTALGAGLVLLAGAAFYVVTVTREREAAEAAARRETREAGRARAAEAEAQAKLAESLVAQGDALGSAGRWGQARARYAEAVEVFLRNGLAPLPADLGTLNACLHSPPALLGWRAHEGQALCVGISPDGRRAVSGGEDRAVAVWDAATGRKLLSVEARGGTPIAVAFVGDGREFAAVLSNGAFTVWEESGAVARTFRGTPASLSCASFSPDGRQALAGSPDNTLLLWDVERGEPVKYYSGHTTGVLGAALSADGRIVVSGGGDGVLMVWNAASGRRLHAIRASPSALAAVALSPDGSRALSGSYFGNLRLWEPEAGREIRLASAFAGTVKCAAFSGDGRLAVTGGRDGELAVWDAREGRVTRSLSRHEGEVNGVALAAGGGRAISAGSDGRLLFWDLGPGREEARLAGHAGPVRSVAFSREGRLVLSGSEDQTVRLWDAATGRELRRLSGHAGHVQAAALSPDGRRAASGGRDEVVRIWDLAAGREERVLSGHESSVTCVAFSPNGGQVLSGSLDRTLRLWDVESGREVRKFEGHASAIYAAAFSADGTKIVSGSQDRTLRWWDAASGAELAALRGHSQRVAGVAVSPDGRRALSGGYDESVRLWNLGGRREERALIGHRFNVWSVAFSPDGRLALSGGADATVRIWEVETGRELRVFHEHPNWIHAVAFSPEGGALAWGGMDPELRLRDLRRPVRYRELEPRVAAAREALARDPSDAAALGAMGEWYAFRGAWDSAAEFLEKARGGGAQVSALERGRCLWQTGDLAGACRAFEEALEAGEAPDSYLRLCLAACAK